MKAWQPTSWQNKNKIDKTDKILRISRPRILTDNYKVII